MNEKPGCSSSVIAVTDEVIFSSTRVFSPALERYAALTRPLCSPLTTIAS